MPGDKPPHTQKPPHSAAHPAHCGVLWSVQHSPCHREGISFQREWLHPQQPLPWSCSSHSNYSNSPHIIFPSGLMCFTLSALDGSTEMQSSPSLLPGWSHQNMEQLNEPGRRAAFHQGTEELSMGNTKGKAQLTPTLFLWRGREGNALLSYLNGILHT